MGTKLGLHSAAFLHALMRPQIVLSAACAGTAAIAAGLTIVADANGTHAAGATAWWVALAASLAAPFAIGVTYTRRARDLEDEALGLVDVGTLPADVTAPLFDDTLRGD